MAQTVADVMTRDPQTIDVSRPVAEAARIMRDADTGALIVTDSGRVAGIVTDRDITVRVVAEQKDPLTPLREACSGTDIATVGPDTSIAQAVQIMRTKAVRRLPVVQNNKAVGVVSLGDLAIERDEHSALADISAAPANE